MTVHFTVAYWKKLDVPQGSLDTVAKQTEVAIMELK